MQQIKQMNDKQTAIDGYLLGFGTECVWAISKALSQSKVG